MQLEEHELQRLLKEAEKRDLSNNGYCDARSGAINFWAGPDDHPEGWRWPFTESALKYPREWLGVIYWKLNGQEWIIQALNYAALRADHGTILPYGDKRHPYANRPEDIAWVKAKFAELWGAALPLKSVPTLAALSNESEGGKR